MTNKKEEVKGYDFSGFKKDALTKPRDAAWENWFKMDKIGDKAQGFIADVFYRKAEGLYKAQRGITLKQQDGTYINVAIKRLSFILNKTNDMRLGDPLTVEFESELPSNTKGFSKTKVMAFYGAKLPENASNKTVLELDNEDCTAQGVEENKDELESYGDKEIKADEVPFK